MKDVLRGLAMGMAEVVPGVSGGTIAFITGIYEKLLKTVNQCGALLLGLTNKEKRHAAWRQIDIKFLIQLIVGMVLGIVIGVIGISKMIEHYPPVVWGFFWGLILASLFWILKQVKDWTMWAVISFIVACGLTVWVTGMTPRHGDTHLVMVFLSGAIAISALILPGISGSFMLLLLGMYQYIVTDNLKSLITSFSTDSLIVIIVFGLGCVFGLFTSARVLSWLYHKYQSITLAAMAGVVLGSLVKIWPWQNPTLFYTDGGITDYLPEGNDFKILQAKNVLPTHFEGNPMTVIVLIAFVLGVVLVWGMSRTQSH